MKTGYIGQPSPQLQITNLKQKQGSREKNINTLLKPKIILFKSLMVNTIIVVSAILALAAAQASDTAPVELTKLTNAQVWGFGVLAGIGISAIGFFAALVLIVAKRCCNIKCFQTLVKFLFSLSCGALVGDAVIHILSEAYANQETNNKIVSLIFMASIFSFLIIDRILHAVGIAHSHWVGQKCEGDRENHGHHHHELSQKNHSHKVENQQDPEQPGCQHNHPHPHTHNNPEQAHNHKHEDHNCQDKEAAQKMGSSQSSLAEKPMTGSKTQLKELEDNQRKQVDIQGDGKQKEKEKKCCHSFAGKGSAGYINIVGSLIHNFIDGLALGVAFATANPTEIIPVLVAIIAHEIPRELGDVAILLRSSFTEMQTMLCNGVVNFVSLIGVFIGLAVVNMSTVAKTYIMVFVAGNFIYIASDIWQHILKNKSKSAKCENALEFMGLSVGIGAMFLLTLLESSSEHEH